MSARALSSGQSDGRGGARRFFDTVPRLRVLLGFLRAPTAGRAITRGAAVVEGGAVVLDCWFLLKTLRSQFKCVLCWLFFVASQRAACCLCFPSLPPPFMSLLF